MAPGNSSGFAVVIDLRKRVAELEFDLVLRDREIMAYRRHLSGYPKGQELALEQSKRRSAAYAERDDGQAHGNRGGGPGKGGAGRGGPAHDHGAKP